MHCAPRPDAEGAHSANDAKRHSLELNGPNTCRQTGYAGSYAWARTGAAAEIAPIAKPAKITKAGMRITFSRRVAAFAFKTNKDHRIVFSSSMRFDRARRAIFRSIHARNE